MRRIDVLSNGVVNDLAARVANQSVVPFDNSATLAEPPRYSPILYWSCARRISGGTYTNGVNWDPQFDDYSASIIKYDEMSPTGSIHFLVRDNPGSQGARRARVTLEASERMSVLCDLRITAGRVQVDVNGSFTEYTASQAITLEFKQGYNTVTLRANSASGDVLLLGKLYDGINSWWIPPGYSPARGGIGGSSSSSGTGKFGLVEGGLGGGGLE